MKMLKCGFEEEYREFRGQIVIKMEICLADSNL